MTEGWGPGPPALVQDLRSLLDSLAATLETPLALLSRDDDEWRFEGEAFPVGNRDAHLPLATSLRQRALTGEPLWEGLPGLVLGRVRSREWVLLIPGSPEAWRDTPADAIIGDARRDLRRVLGRHGPRDPQRFGGR